MSLLLPIPRRPELDLLRTVALFCLVLLHSQQLFLDPAWRAPVADWLGTVPAAPAYLFSVGLLFSCRRDRPWAAVLRRALTLLVLGYALGALRAAPLLFGAPGPQGSFAERATAIELLQATAISLLVLRLAERASATVLLGLIVLLAGGGTLLWGLTDSPGLLDFVGGKEPFAVYPLFPWLAYPLLGLLTGRTRAQAWVGLALAWLVAGFALSGFLASDFTLARTAPATVLKIMGGLLLWRMLANALRPALLGRPGRIVRFYSANFPAFYVLTWLLLSYAVIPLGFRTLPPERWLGVYAAALGLATLLVALITRLQRPRQESPFVPTQQYPTKHSA